MEKKFNGYSNFETQSVAAFLRSADLCDWVQEMTRQGKTYSQVAAKIARVLRVRFTAEWVWLTDDKVCHTEIEAMMAVMARPRVW